MKGAPCWPLLVWVLVVPGSLEAQEPAAVPDRVEVARSVVQALADRDFTAVVERFDSTMRQAMSRAQLAESWDALLGQVGAFDAQGEATSDRVQGFDRVTVAATFARGSIDLRVVFNRAGQVSGLWFTPHTPAPSSSPPPYADTGAFREVAVTVGQGDLILPGTLSLPTSAGGHPAVVLVHGSGPHDRNETIGPNQPFRDLAWGLASRGIAVLRYEKRTRMYASRIAAAPNGFTLREESEDDALAAVTLLRTTPGIDSSRIFVLGHSLGGMLAPRIATRDPGIAGVIILAGSTRPLDEILLAQIDYIARLDDSVSSEEEQRIIAIREGLAAVAELTAADTSSPTLLLGAPPSYWLDLRAYHPTETARTLAKPMLVLQGGRDYQVTMDDLQGWETALSGRSDVRFRVFPDLNHLFITGQGRPTPTEYQIPGHVAHEVIEEIAAWIHP